MRSSLPLPVLVSVLALTVACGVTQARELAVAAGDSESVTDVGAYQLDAIRIGNNATLTVSNSQLSTPLIEISAGGELRASGSTLTVSQLRLGEGALLLVGDGALVGTNGPRVDCSGGEVRLDDAAMTGGWAVNLASGLLTGVLTELEASRIYVGRPAAIQAECGDVTCDLLYVKGSATMSSVRSLQSRAERRHDSHVYHYTRAVLGEDGELSIDGTMDRWKRRGHRVTLDVNSGSGFAEVDAPIAYRNGRLAIRNTLTGWISLSAGEIDLSTVAFASETFVSTARLTLSDITVDTVGDRVNLYAEDITLRNVLPRESPYHLDTTGWQGGDAIELSGDDSIRATYPGWGGWRELEDLAGDYVGHLHVIRVFERLGAEVTVRDVLTGDALAPAVRVSRDGAVLEPGTDYGFAYFAFVGGWPDQRVRIESSTGRGEQIALPHDEYFIQCDLWTHDGEYAG